MQDGRPTAEATDKCLRSLTACQSVEVLKQDEWAENRLADFNLWIYGSGALARGRASLDSRLATRRDARDVVVNLLRLLATIVERCKTLAETPELYETGSSILSEDTEESSHLSPEGSPVRPLSPWSDDSVSDFLEVDEPSNDQLYDSMRDIERILEQLARIIAAVRRSGRRSRLAKADQRFNPEEHEELKRYLTTILAVCPCPGSTRKNQDFEDLSEVQQRLIYCNLKRRNRFLYAQWHSKGLAPDTEILNQKQDVESVAQISDEKVGLESPKSKSSGDAENPTVRTGTTASAVSDSLVMDAAELLPTPGASTVLSSTVIDMDYPRPPKLNEAARVFQCPCCCETLPVDMAKPNLWKKHVADDLSPYTCILTGCPQPYVLFTNKETWKQHLLESHTSLNYWVCFCCGTAQFYSEKDFIVHSKTEHAKFIPADQIPLLTTICRRSAPTEVTSCPICDWPEDKGMEANKDNLLDHIAKAVHSFALQALPWADENGQEPDTKIAYCADKVYDWLVKYDLSSNPSQVRPPQQKKATLSEYFHRFPYFADSSEVSSSSELESTASWEVELERMKEAETTITFRSANSDSEMFDTESSRYLEENKPDESDAPLGTFNQTGKEARLARQTTMPATQSEKMQKMETLNHDRGELTRAVDVGDRMFCHACGGVWIRRDHGLGCLHCQSEFTEIIEIPPDTEETWDSDGPSWSASQSPQEGTQWTRYHMEGYKPKAHPATDTYQPPDGRFTSFPGASGDGFALTHSPGSNTTYEDGPANTYHQQQNSPQEDTTLLNQHNKGKLARHDPNPSENPKEDHSVRPTSSQREASQSPVDALLSEVQNTAVPGRRRAFAARLRRIVERRHPRETE